MLTQQAPHVLDAPFPIPFSPHCVTQQALTLRHFALGWGADMDVCDFTKL